MTELRFLHFAFSLLALYQCVKFHPIPIDTFRDMLRTSFIAKIKRGKLLRNYWEQGYGSCILHLLYWPSIKNSCFISFPSILSEICSGQAFYCKRGSNSVNTADRVTVLAFCNSPHGPLSVYQVSLNYIQHF